MKTLDEAIEQQLKLHERIDRGEKLSERAWRAASLNDAYEYKSMPHYGMGFFPVHKATQQVCECKMEWYRDGEILICPVCFLEGT